jgi:uncharacterized protein YecE (DUF72 family)
MIRVSRREYRNLEKKELASAAERFNYFCSEPELRDLATELRELSERSEATHALFNDCYRDFGQRNPIDFQQLLASVGSTVCD